ncbi:MAG TPA: hypothetical protein VKX28_00705 [Xanthobacteraceae bacterium]|nr:hypothetical protein [Xanthobacteraceae bacterium]
MLRASHRISLFTAVFALALPTLVSAATPREVLRDFGMLGTWANDCSQPSSADNFYTVYAGMPDGNVRRTYYNTPDRKNPYNEYYIIRAIRLPADQLSYRQEGSVNHDKMDVILLKDGDKYKIWSSVRDDDNTVLVENGKFPKSGDESPWQAKCHD